MSNLYLARLCSEREWGLVMKRLLKRHAGPGSDEALTSAKEREANPRIFGPFPARVRRADARGKDSEIRTVLDDLSASDFNLRLSQRVELRDKLFVVAQVHEATVALSGMVLRVEPQTEELCGVTVAINRYRFVSSFDRGGPMK
jgi:hypothetical protein